MWKTLDETAWVAMSVRLAADGKCSKKGLPTMCLNTILYLFNMDR